jgi:[ribosomal protein S5]-alanine N-acetyltransferase
MDIRLRRPALADVDLILALHRDPLACAHNPSDMLATRAEAEERYRAWDAHWRDHGFGYWTVCLDGRAVGFCGVKVMRLKGEEVLNLFYRLDPAVWGRGVATRAVGEVMRWTAANRPGWTAVARIRPDNEASQRIAERAGLRRVEDLDDDGEDGLDWIYTVRDPAQR